MADLDAMMRKIRGLLKKAEDSTFASEAETFYAKAQELMRKYAIEEELLWATEPERRTTPIVRQVEIFKKSQTGNNARMHLFGAIARNSRCRCYFTDGYAKVFGFETDVNFVEMLYVSLSVQMQMEMLREQAKSNINMRTFKANFIEAYANRIDDRMWRANHEYVPPSGSVELVLRNREEEVGDFYRENTRHMHFVDISKSQGKYSDAAQSAGRAAADKADLSAGRRGPTRELSQ